MAEAQETESGNGPGDKMDAQSSASAGSNSFIPDVSQTNGAERSGSAVSPRNQLADSCLDALIPSRKTATTVLR
jgi:hypothetical protein